MKRAVGTFCSNQPSALELIKTRKKKDQRFALFMQVSTTAHSRREGVFALFPSERHVTMFLIVSPQEAERNRLCRRLQLKDIIPVEMQRMTKYPLLLENIAKYTGMNAPACCVFSTAEDGFLHVCFALQRTARRQKR